MSQMTTERVAARLGPATRAWKESLRELIRLMRPTHWVKNVFVLAPLFFTPEALGVPALLSVGAGFVCFSLLASAVYILNDYADRHADRMHPTKRLRPLAAGTVSPAMGLSLAAALLVAATLGALALSPLFAGLAGIYLASNLLYSFGLKNVSIVDVMVIAAGFVLRVYAGAVLIAVDPGAWIIVCTGLIALFLALAKRRDDLVRSLDDGHRRSLDGYTKYFLDTAIAIVLGASVVSYIIFAIGTGGTVGTGADPLLITVPFVVAGILRYLQITLVEERSGAPTKLVLSDRFLIAVLATWGVITFLLLHV